ncbi:MAG: hypothetical protein ABJF88_12910 [Rhodothermales bacterium]
MADSQQETNRKSTTIFIIATLVVIFIVGAIISVRGCHEPNDMEEIIDPDGPLPGTQDATGSRFAPDAAPLLAA